MNKLFYFLCIFLYCSNIQFVFLPDRLRTKLIIGIIGFFYFVFFLIRRKYIYISLYKPIFGKLLPLFIWMLLSILINQSTDWWFLQYTLVQFVYIFGAIVIIELCGITDIKNLSQYLLLYVLVQNTIAFIGLQYPQAKMIVQTITSESIFITHEGQLTYRAFGFGDHVFFGGGVWASIGMLITVYLFKSGTLSKKLFALIYFYIFFTGLFVARTSIAGLSSLILIFVPLRQNWYKIMGLFVAIVILFELMGLLESLLLDYGMSLGNAFEIYNNIVEGDGLTTSSSSGTMEMWKIVPNNIKTWILGDAQYFSSTGGYYMDTDVGYLRIIWYGGIVGLLLYINQIIQICHLIRKRIVYDKVVHELLFMYIVIMCLSLLKGHYDTSCVIYLMYALVMKNLALSQNKLVSRI